MSDVLVSSLAFLLSAIAVAIGVGPWTEPYELRTFRRLRDARGMIAARLGWVIIALIAAGCGAAIWNNVRPFGQIQGGPAVCPTAGQAT